MSDLCSNADYLLLGNNFVRAGESKKVTLKDLFQKTRKFLLKILGALNFESKHFNASSDGGFHVDTFGLKTKGCQSLKCPLKIIFQRILFGFAKISYHCSAQTSLTQQTKPSGSQDRKYRAQIPLSHSTRRFIWLNLYFDMFNAIKLNWVSFWSAPETLQWKFSRVLTDNVDRDATENIGTRAWENSFSKTPDSRD